MTWLYVIGRNPRTGATDIFALTQDFDEAEHFEALAHRDGWKQVRIEAQPAPAPVLDEAEAA
jgi:hypothetical protein